MFALKYLTGAELLTATLTWVDPAEDARRKLDSFDTTRPLLIRLIEARTAIQAALAAREPDDPDNEGRALDARHDALGRGLFNTLTAFSQLAADEARAGALISLRDTIFPDGLRILRATFAEEAGQVDARADRVTPELRAELEAMIVEGRSLAAVLDELQAVGRALGGAVTRSTESAARAAGPTPRGKLRTATQRLVRVIRVIGDALEMGNADDEAIELFFGPLRVAAESAQRRAIARNSGATPPPPPTPGVATPTTPTTPAADPGATPPRED